MNEDEKAVTFWHSLLFGLRNDSGLNNKITDITKKNKLPDELLTNKKKHLSEYPELEEIMDKLSREGFEDEDGESNSDEQDQFGDENYADQMGDSQLGNNEMAEDVSEDSNGTSTSTNMDGNDIGELGNRSSMSSSEILIESKNLIDLFGLDLNTSITVDEFNKWKETSERWSSSAGDEKSRGFTISEERISESLKNIESRIMEKIPLMEVLSDDELSERVSPNIAMVEHLLNARRNLSPHLLRNAKAIIKKYVDEVTEIFKLKFEKAVRTKINPEMEAKKVFRNLNLKRTIWSNLPNWDPESKKLYVDKLYYHRAGKKTLPSKIIVIVDQSGSMLEAMVQTTILASIFATLPNVTVELYAFDTVTIDLTSYVDDPFEVLMQTNLGGGTHINKAIIESTQKIEDSKHTAVVLITDYEEFGSYDELFSTIKSLTESQVTFLSIASLNSRRSVRVNSRFVHRLRSIGIKTIIGGPEEVVYQLKQNGIL